jgi:hypothetical protein
VLMMIEGSEAGNAWSGEDLPITCMSAEQVTRIIG